MEATKLVSPYLMVRKTIPFVLCVIETANCLIIAAYSHNQVGYFNATKMEQNKFSK